MLKDKTLGVMISYGPNSFTQCAWGNGKFDAKDFKPENLVENVQAWIKVLYESGVDYVVLITKHHDGLCLWDTKYTDYKSTVVNPKFDLVQLVSDECKKYDIELGLYYSLWDLNYPEYEDDAKYNQFVRNQLEELLTKYNQVGELWFDGAWDKDHPNGQPAFNPNWITEKHPEYLHGERWEWEKLYDFIHSIAPDCEVINNSGCARPGTVKYMPIDVRVSERVNFVVNEKIQMANPSHQIQFDGKEYNLPLEYVVSLCPNWFYTGGTRYVQTENSSLKALLTKAKSEGNRLLINIGPDKNCRLITCEEEALRSLK